MNRRCPVLLLTTLPALFGTIYLATTAADARDGDRPPDLVRRIVQRTFPGMRIEDIDRRQRGRDVYYEVELERDNREVRLEVTRDGWIRKIELEIDDDDLPEPAKQAVRKAFPRSRMTEVDQVSEINVVYDVDIIEGGKKREVYVTPAGRIVEIRRR